MNESALLALKTSFATLAFHFNGHCGAPSDVHAFGPPGGQYNINICMHKEPSNSPRCLSHVSCSLQRINIHNYETAMLFVSPSMVLPNVLPSS